MNDRLIVSRRAQLRSASQPMVTGSLPAWVVAHLPLLRTTPQREFNPAAWRLAMGLMRVPGFDLPKRLRRGRLGPWASRCTHGSGDGRTSRNVHFFAPGNPLCTLQGEIQ